MKLGSTERASAVQSGYRDLGIVAGIAIIMLGAAILLNLFERVNNWTRAHESWQLDELAVAVSLLAASLAALALYRWRVLLRELRQRQNAEHRLRLLMTAVEQSGEGIAVADMDGVVLSLNNAFAEMHGYTVPELLGKHISIFYKPEHRPDWEAAIRQLRETGSQVNETWHVRRDGTVFPAMMHNSLMQDDQGKPSGYVGTMRDITVEKQTEQALNREQRTLQLLMDNIPDTIYVKDSESRFTRINRAQAEFLGVDAPEDAIGKKDSDFYGELADGFLTDEQEIMTSGRSLVGKVEQSGRPGCELRWFSTTKVPLYDELGSVIGTAGISRDITELRQAEQALRDSEQRSRKLVENLPIGLYRTAVDGHLEYANPALVSMLGFQSFEELADRYSDNECVGLPHSRTECQRHFEHTDAVISMESPCRARDGSEVSIRENIKAVRDADGNVSHYEGTVEDITERALAHDELRKVQERTELALWGASLIAWDWNVPTGTIVFNHRWAEMLGYEPSEIVPKITAIRGQIHADDLQAVVRKLQAHMRDQTPFFEAEHRVMTKDGEWKWLLSRGKVVERAGPGTAVRLTGTSLDITERKCAEDALRCAHHELEERVRERTQQLADAVASLRQEIEQRRQVMKQLAQRSRQLQSLADHSPDQIFRLDRELRHVFVNRRMSEITGIPIEKFAGKTNQELGLPKDFCELWERNFESVFSDAKPNETEYSLDGPLGPRHYQSRVVPEFDTAGQVETVLGTTRDITGHRRVEEALRENRDLLQAIIEGTNDAVYLMDLEGRCRLVNPAGAGLFDLKPVDLVGKTYRDVFPAEDALRLDEHSRQVIQAGSTITTEHQLRLDGDVHYFLTTKVPHRNSTGEIVGVIGVGRDITEFKQAQEQLRRSERLVSIGTLAAGIAHEINNPTGGILMAAQAARDEIDQAEFVRKCLEEIIEDAKRCGRIVKSVLRFSRHQPTDKHPSDVSLLIKHVVDLSQDLVGEYEADLALELDDKSTSVHLNSTEFEQLLFNLIKNAVEVGGRGTCVKIRTKQLDKSLRLMVSDNGPGMTQQQVKHIFDPFYTTRQQLGGTGLGLSVVHGIVEAHGGEIEVESAPQAGTTFTIDWPC